MKILLVGANGTIGRIIASELKDRHQIISAGRTTGEVKVDISDSGSIAAMYEQVGPVDAVVCAAGEALTGPLVEMTRNDVLEGFNTKLLGQIDIVLQGFKYVSDNGSFTLTSGCTEREPVRNASSGSTINGALMGFVSAAAIEMPRGHRINVIGPGLLEVSADRYQNVFPGYIPVPSKHIALAYVRSIEGAITGRLISV